MSEGGIPALQDVLHREVPLTAHMGVRVAGYDGKELVLQADLAPNVNIHGTAFGGSLYSICAIACWGLLHCRFQEAGITAGSVLAEGQIQYRLPVSGVIEERCRVPGSFEAFLAEVKSGRRTGIELQAEVLTGRGRAVIFRGRYSSF
ncbi:MAG: YiiD C-terminal domain-containing protein [Sedimenticola sp.]